MEHILADGTAVYHAISYSILKAMVKLGNDLHRAKDTLVITIKNATQGGKSGQTQASAILEQTPKALLVSSGQHSAHSTDAVGPRRTNHYDSKIQNGRVVAKLMSDPTVRWGVVQFIFAVTNLEIQEPKCCRSTERLSMLYVFLFRGGRHSTMG